MKKNLASLLILIFLINFSSALQISEIMFNPIQDENYNEYIEIYNNEEEDFDLEEITLCDKSLLLGYIYQDNLFNEDSFILKPGEYAIITDGGSGTEVYENFNVNENSKAFHTETASLCGGLSNKGKELFFKNSNETIISLNYEVFGEEGESLQFCEDWISSSPTPGEENNCKVEEPPEENFEEDESKIEISFEEEIYFDEEFLIEVSYKNLKESDFKIWVECSEKICSENYLDDWISGNYYIENFFNENPQEIKLKIKNDCEEILDKCELKYRLRNQEEFSEEIKISKKEIIEEIEEDDLNEDITISNSENNQKIFLSNKKAPITGEIVYESKEKKILDSSPWILSIICLVLLAFFVLRNNNI